ncbi:MAG TPA: hypothetical protein VF174_02635 [Micromonosporaceae bacterium]
MAVQSPIIDLDERPDLADRAFAPRPGRHRYADPQPRSWSARPWLLALIAILAALISGGIALILPDAADRPRAPADSRATDPDRPPQVDPAAVAPKAPADGAVQVNFDGTFFSWAVLDADGHLWGSDNLSALTWPGSIVKVWIVADFLRQAADRGDTPSQAQLDKASRAIRDSDDRSANDLYQAAGGRRQLRRMISTCGLTDTVIEGDRWRSVRMSARDAVRLGRCVTDGRAAGPAWTDWVRREMAMVRGSIDPVDQPYGGRWGIIDGLPAGLQESGVGIKNGWIVVESEGEWHVNCLAVADRWAMAVLTRYPAERGLEYGARACADVAARLVPGAAG